MRLSPEDRRLAGGPSDAMIAGQMGGFRVSRRMLPSLPAGPLAASVVLAASVAAQEAVIDIPPPGSAATTRLAVADCSPREAAVAEACATVSAVVRDDLAFEGLFRLVEPGAWGSSTGKDDRPDFAGWRSLGADFLIVTSMDSDGERLRLDAAVWSLAARRSILDRRYTDGVANARRMAHALSDAVTSLTQYRGVARTRIAFVSDRDGDRRSKDVYVADYDGQGRQRFTLDGLTSILPDWSPGGRRIAYTFIGIGRSQAIAVPIDGGEAVSLCPEGVQCVAPEWSPEGDRIAYARTGVDGRTKIWVSDADGRHPRQVTDGPGADTAPTWSPTGQQIAFTSDRSGTPQVWVVGAEGLGLERLTRHGSYADGASWSPSAVHGEIAFTSRRAGRLGIAILDLETGLVRPLPTGRADCEKPTWSPSGRHLMFSCRDGGRHRLVVADRLGRRAQVVEAGPGNDSQPDWGPFPGR